MRKHRTNSLIAWVILLNLSLAATAAVSLRNRSSVANLPSFYAHVRSPHDICNSANGTGISHAGYIGLEGDDEAAPKRSFFWYFEAQEDSENAPVILTIGGGPGTTGMVNTLATQSHCMVTANGTIPNPNAWTERFNLLALDHPIGVGFSYGTMVNNSRSAAIDVYDFLQKFYFLYPKLAKNRFIINAGSYGGTYAPHIATVIHEQNKALALGKGRRGSVHINLDSLMITNPMSDALSHFRWTLYQSCHNTDLYNSTTCMELYTLLPACLERIQFAYQNSTVENRVAAFTLCSKLRDGDKHGTMMEDVSKKCDGSVEGCFPYFGWLSEFMNSEKTKRELGVPADVEFQAISDAVWNEFANMGDHIQQPYLLYGPLLRDGIRILHYIGAKDANCAPQGIFSFLKLLPSPYQDRFLNAPDVPWPSAGEATVRVVGEGAGDMTYILIDDAGHFVTHDQPALSKKIIEHWIDNRSYA
ncbi:alpha/beta-hydrolase [Ramaria rubella]|nr:alpha/beta-hydrolase [Ramaria rubella]